ncbi:hypothetical protein [Litoribacter populi]|uniref:hypothetical protein n=1 Tax=Litoribacter populi TaxID=2598460 RepID=UPI00117F315B|nr:hypothetical protein [Litoribacter populi]
MNNRFTLKIAALALASAFYSCSESGYDEENVIIPEESINYLDFDQASIETQFNKVVTVSDVSGNYSVRVNFGSDEDGVVEDMLSYTNFTLAMTYPDDLMEASNENSDETSREAPDREFGEITMTVMDLNLDEDANGFFLEVSYDQEKSIGQNLMTFANDINYDSPDRWMYYGRVEYETTVNQNPDIRVEWYYRGCSTCSMNYLFGATLSEQNPVSELVRYDSRRIRAKVRSNWWNYKVFFKKWGNDPWRQVY